MASNDELNAALMTIDYDFHCGNRAEFTYCARLSQLCDATALKTILELCETISKVQDTYTEIVRHNLREGTDGLQFW
jgi:hypothetical protein